MNQAKYVFAQLIAFLDRNKFNRIVAKYHGDRYVKHFTCWNQLLTMMFGQLANRESLRDVVTVLDAHHNKCYHLGVGKNVTKSTLARANQERDYRIFEEFAYYLIGVAHKKRCTDIFQLKGNVYAFDSTTIDLCLSVFWWAKFRSTKGGIKVHTLYDIETQIPTYFHITPAAVNDSKVMDGIPYESGSYYIFDRGYNKFKSMYNIHLIGAYFIVRAKHNVKYQVIKSQENLEPNILSDEVIRFTGSGVVGYYPTHLRLVRFWDEERQREYVYLTNAMHLAASQVALLYKNRWQIELFFKWLKQHLKIKRFWGTTENAVRIQIYVAISAYCLVSIVQHDMKLERNIYSVLQIVSASLTDKMPLRDLFDKTKNQNIKEQPGLNGPTLFNF